LTRCARCARPAWCRRTRARPRWTTSRSAGGCCRRSCPSRPPRARRGARRRRRPRRSAPALVTRACIGLLLSFADQWQLDSAVAFTSCRTAALRVLQRGAARPAAPRLAGSGRAAAATVEAHPAAPCLIRLAAPCLIRPAAQDTLAKAERARRLAEGARAAAARAAGAPAGGIGAGTALARIAARAGAAGPLALLARCLAARGRVRVVTRHARGVRGVAIGAPRILFWFNAS